MDDSAPAPPVAPSPDWQDAHVADDGGEDAAFSDHDEDTYEQIRNMMENPVMQPIQAALKKQLMETKLRVGAEVRDKEAELKEVKAEREQVGVELYAVQQQLARLQMDLESKHNKFNILTNVRAKAEDDLRVLNEHADALENEVKAENKKVEKNQVDLEQLNQTLQQVEKYNEELKGEVAVTRRATYKAEETVSELEKTKAEQDVYIDMLNENLKRLQEQSALYEAQLQSQSQETDAAKTTLLDAAKEMETIAFEKKQLMQQWKSSLIGIQRRDEALQATQSAIGNLVEDEKATRAEIGGTKKFIRIQQAENEKLVGVMSKLDSEAAFMEDKIRAFADERARLEERYEMLKSSLEHTVASSEQVYADYEGVVEGMSSLDRNIETVNRERTKLEAEAAARVSEQMTHSKAAKNLAKEVVVLQEQLSAKEQEESSILNEMARIRVDSLNTQAHNSQLQETLDKLNSELDEKDKLIEKYEMEIRQRNDQIEKKMSTVDRLNRKYEALVKGEPEEENLGPLEATIKHIGKETERVQEENREAQKRWLRTQTELVSISEDLEKVSELSSQSHSQEAILEQKRLRVDRSIEATEAKVASLHGDIRNLHRDMTRLNDMISKNASLQEGLANENYALETEFVNELKEMEEESVRLDNQVKTLKEKKAELLKDIVEAERQLLLWEKKIQLEKEAQAALDPNIGNSETKAMEREIHRMRLRYEAIKREQDRMVSEMERAVLKREVIAQKYSTRGKHGAPASADDITMADLRKKLKSVKREARKVSQETKKHDRMVREKMDQIETIAVDLEKASAEYSKLEDDANEKQRRVNNMLYEKQRKMDLVQKQQKLLDRFTRAKMGQIMPLLPEDESRVAEDLERAVQTQDAVVSVIKSLSDQHGHLSEVLERVLKLTEAA